MERYNSSSHALVLMSTVGIGLHPPYSILLTIIEEPVILIFKNEMVIHLQIYKNKMK